MMGFLLASHCVRPQIDRYCKVQGCEVRISFLRLNLFILVVVVFCFFFIPEQLKSMSTTGTGMEGTVSFTDL